jgi:hypothetical protein
VGNSSKPDRRVALAFRNHCRACLLSDHSHLGLVDLPVLVHEVLELLGVGANSITLPELLVGVLVRNSAGSEGSKDSSSGKLHFIGSGGGQGGGKMGKNPNCTTNKNGGNIFGLIKLGPDALSW